jgi:DNA-binding transcriptional LysR family regulator
MENWDDLRLFLSTARAGSSRQAGRELGINQSTVSRRIRLLEERTATRLFDRRPGGLVLTEAGEELLALAGAVEERVADVDRRLQGRDETLNGQVRVSLPDMFVGAVAAQIAGFALVYPDIEVEVIVDNENARLTHREADLALRIASAPPEQLVGRRIAPLGFAIYGARGMEVARPLDPSALPWVRWEERWNYFPAERWLDKHVSPEQVRARVNTSHAQAELVAAGVGVGIAPCYTGDVDPRRVRLSETMDFKLVLWLLTHEDLRRTGRVLALMRFLGDALTADRKRFMGESP